jgi:TonB-linked SusC/RagA family outer membrane protein
MRITRPLILLVLLGLSGFTYGQKISGEILDKSSRLPIGSATVSTGTGQTVQSDASGKFTLDLQGAKSFSVSFVGYQPKVVQATSAATYTVELEMVDAALQQVVVVGYGTQKKANLTGAVATVDVSKTFGSRPVTDVARGLQGAVAGLTITTPTGDLGTDPKIRLRGLQGSINTGAAGAQPLILVDNVEIPSLQMINPDDIESMSVLKDAASASIYGTRGAWGVILITTKSGKKGAPSRITYSNNFAWAKPTTTPKLMGAADNAEASFSALHRANPSQSVFGVIGYSIDSPSIAKMREWDRLYAGQDLGDEMVAGRDYEIKGGKLYFYRTWDPEAKYLKDWTLQQRHDLSFSGGGEKTTYTLGLGYLDQAGALKANPDEFKRYNFTLGINSTVKDWLDVRGKIIYSNTLTSTPFIFSGTQYGPFYYLYRWPSNYPYGTVDGKPFRGAVTEVQQAKMDQNKRALSRISAGGTIKPMKGLTIDMDYTYTNTNQHLNQTGGNTLAYDFWSFNGTALNYTNYQSATYNKARYYSYWNEINTGKVFATYSKTINTDHALKFILGGDIEQNKATSQSSERANLLDPNYGQLPLATGAQLVDGSNTQWSTLGVFGRINYAYKNKFLLEVNGRRDGSSRFPSGDLYGFFPSASAGYVLTEESFMEPVQNWLSFLKVRGSYGSIGNQAITGNGSLYRFLPVMSSTNSNWILPTGNAVSMTTPAAISPTLTWEKVSTIDFGVDARFLNNKLGFTFDWYQRTTSDMIGAGITLPSSFGAGAPAINFGELQGRGWELSVDFNHTLSNGLHFGITANLSDAQERISKYANVTKQLPAPIGALNTSYYEGMKLGEIWGFVTDRLFTPDDFTNGSLKAGIPTQTKLESGTFKFGPGDVKYRDINGDGEIFTGTGTLDNPGDKQVIGNSTPRYQYGVRIDADWKGFDLSIYVQGVAKRDLWASGSVVFPGFRGVEAWYAHQLDYWTPSNPDAFYPAPVDYGATVDRWDFQPQTRYLLNMAYTRIKNITFGYALPARLISKAGMQRARIYFTGENLITFDHLGGVPIDPEIDFSQTQLDNDRAGFGRVYPYRKTVAVGLQVTF